MGNYILRFTKLPKEIKATKRLTLKRSILFLKRENFLPGSSRCWAAG